MTHLRGIKRLDSLFDEQQAGVTPKA